MLNDIIFIIIYGQFWASNLNTLISECAYLCTKGKDLNTHYDSLPVSRSKKSVIPNRFSICFHSGGINGPVCVRVEFDTIHVV